MATTLQQLTMALEELPDHWWLVGLRGLAAVIFGILAFVWPGVTLAVLVMLFGVYAIVDGVLALFSAVHPNSKPVWLLILEGIVGIAAGFAAFLVPGVTALVLLYIIAAWAIIQGILEIGTAIRLREVIEHELMLAIAGVLSVVFGILLFVQPGAGALAVIWLIGIYAVLYGIAMLGLAWKLHSVHEHSSHAPPSASPQTSMP